jgi:hypothetical protein
MAESKSTQLNIRIDPMLEQSIDRARIAKARELGRIPSRSEIVRMALDSYLALGEVAAVDSPPPTRGARTGKRG